MELVDTIKDAVEIVGLAERDGIGTDRVVYAAIAILAWDVSFQPEEIRQKCLDGLCLDLGKLVDFFSSPEQDLLRGVGRES